MKAAQINEYGDASVVTIQETDKPVALDGQVLVEVRAASLNPFDTMVRSGMLKEMVPLEFPVTLGGDISGIVSDVGQGVEGLAVGDNVYGQANAVARNSGALAEYAVTKSSQLSTMPKNLNFEEAASLPLVGVSALQALTEHLNLQAGQKLLVHGGTGGIGSIAIQIAKHLGAYVATTVPKDALELAKNLGADEVIDYQSQDFSEIISDYDAVFDTVGGETFEKSLGVLKPNGTVVTMIAQFDEKDIAEKGVKAIYQSTQVTTERLNKLCELVDQGIVKPNVGASYTLDAIQEAFKARESGDITGKVVVKIA